MLATVKAIGGGMLGALMIVAAFLAGARWSELTKSPPAPFVRYEMHVAADGTVTRMDRVTGQLHMVTASGAGDVPERFVAPTTTPAKP
jgi:phosphoribosylaminoimidazole carboxylase (NCAIR synthetase)